MRPRQPVVVGIDGGGTRSLALAVDSTGRVLAVAKAGSLNFFGSGLPAARHNLSRLIGALRRRLPPQTRFRKIVVGCAALFTEATSVEKEKLCRGILPLEQTSVLSDCQTACFGATLGRAGLVVIAGTGSIVLAQNEAGRLTRVGGWGHLLGDAGSAYWIAVESVKAAIAIEEGPDPGMGLVPVIRRWFGARTLSAIVPAIYRSDFAKEDLASLTSHLARKVGSRDPVFRGICRRAGRELAAQASTALKLARLKARPVPVCFVGGVLTKNALVRRSLIAALKEICAIRVAKPKLSPALGSAAIALMDSGVDLTPEVIARLRTHRV